MNIAAKIHRLKRSLKSGPCGSGFLVIVENGDPVPLSARRCPKCGQVHVLRILEEVVKAREKDTPSP